MIRACGANGSVKIDIRRPQRGTFAGKPLRNGAAKAEGASLDKCLEIAERRQSNMGTLAVAVQTATHPSTGKSIFDCTCF
jgi:dihydroxyacetone kinase